MKICTDCAHCKEINASHGNDTLDALRSFIGMRDDILVCARTEHIDPVDGRPRYRACAHERSTLGSCGPNCSRFTPKSKKPKPPPTAQRHD